MGGAKRMMEEHEHLCGIAASILVDAESLGVCEIHHQLIDGGADVVDAYKLANYRITNKQLELPYGIERADFSAIIKEVYDEHNGVSCHACDKNLYD